MSILGLSIHLSIRLPLVLKWALMDTVILKRPDHLQSGSVADMGKPWMFVAAEVTLVNFTSRSSVKYGSPSFEFAHAIGGLLGMNLCHPPVVDVVTAAHGVSKVRPPAVPFSVSPQLRFSKADRSSAINHDFI